MKKLFALLAIAALVSFSSFNEEKTYIVKMNEQQLNVIWSVIDQSNAPHAMVKEVQKFLGDQLAPQMDTTKKK